MLTTIEKMLFLLLAVLAIGATYNGFRDMYRIINRGQGKLHFDKLPARLWHSLNIFITQSTVLKTRLLTSILHIGVAWSFTFYFLVNLGDFLEGFLPDYEFLADLGVINELYRLTADLLSVAALVGVVYFIIRRLYLPNKKELHYHDNILLHPKVKSGMITRDSMIVAFFILIHVGARFLGESVAIAAHDGFDLAQPFASAASVLWAGLNTNSIEALAHVFWWTALGSIVVFFPYFPYTKHAHLFMAPLNYLTRPQRTSLGEMEPMDFEDEDKEQFGANKLEDLSRTQILDAFACIMCNRCQDVCPAYTTGKELSPSALEINKRFLIKDQMFDLANGEVSLNPLLGHAISESAVWACTSCAACIEVCPVGNEPMLDILDIRRDAVLTQGEFPAELQDAFNGMERQGNPWQMSESRSRWANGLDVPTVEDNPNFDLLYWTGCAVSYDPRAQLTARALVKVLKAAGVNFAILGDSENCTGDVARRAGNEYLYSEMATANVEVLNEVKPRRIVVTCPHCFHNIGKEYHQFGGEYEVVHHTELLDELMQAGKLPHTASPENWSNVTFHDPCYLGRQNNIVEQPREALRALGTPLVEMPRNRKNSFCCGAGGAQFWKEEEEGEAKVNLTRYQEAMSTGADTLAVGCPFCMRMFVDAHGVLPDGPEVKDVVEIIADHLPETEPAGD